MQGIMGLGAGSKEEVCSLQAGTEPLVGRPDREELSEACRTCSLCVEPLAAYHEHLRIAELALYKTSQCRYVCWD